MSMGTRTTKTKANFMVRTSRSGVRAATDGNKNTSARARRKSARSQVPASTTRPLKGPDRGFGQGGV